LRLRGRVTVAEAVLKVAEFAEQVRVHPETVREWLRTGKVKGVRLGGDRAGWRIPVSEVDRLLTGDQPSRDS
jgi:excisionase family DNA binding protein